MSVEVKEGRKRSKAYYLNHPKRKQKQFILEPGMKGFLISCNRKERQCVLESYKVLNEYADKLYGEENLNSDQDVSDDDIEKCVEKEVQSLNQVKSEQRRFQSVDSGANNCIFIKTNIDDPCHLATAILKDVEKEQYFKGRFIIRLVPVELTCRAYLDDIRKTVEELLVKLEPSEKTFAINFKVRNNNQLKRDDVISSVASDVHKHGAGYRVNLNNPDILINIDIVKTVACVSILKNYYEFKKYNVQELKIKNSQEQSVKTDKVDDKSEDAIKNDISNLPDSTVETQSLSEDKDESEDTIKDIDLKIDTSGVEAEATDEQKNNKEKSIDCSLNMSEK